MMLPLFPQSPWRCEHGDLELEYISQDAMPSNIASSFWRCLHWSCPARIHFWVSYHNPGQGVVHQ